MASKKLSWLDYQIKNWYLQLFIVAIIFLIASLIGADRYYESWGVYVACSIPILMMGFIVYFGFFLGYRNYKQWEDTHPDAR